MLYWLGKVVVMLRRVGTNGGHTNGGNRGGYRGIDRRGRQRASGQIPPKTLLAQSALLVLGALVPLATVFVREPGAAANGNAIQAMSSLATVAAGVALLGSWKIGDRAAAGWLGIGLLDLGILTMLYHNLSSLGLPPLESAEPFGRVVLCLVVVACVGAAVRAPDVHAEFKPLKVLAFTCLIGFGALAILNRALAPSILSGQNISVDQGTLAACALVWLGLVTWAVITHHERRTPAVSWTGWFVLCRLCGYGAGALLARHTWGYVLMQTVFLFSAAIALVAAAWELRRTAQGQDRYALDLRTVLHETRADVTRERAELDERLHDLRNAVAAMRCADSTLRTHAARLDEETRNRLSEALSSELSRLQTLIEPGRELRSDEFSLSEAMSPVLSTERARGSVIDVRVDPLTVRGDREAMAQVLQNLLTNARLYAPGSAVTIRAEQIVDRVLLRISDDGPGIPEAERYSVFERGARGSTSTGTTGSGIGLYVAARLMREMGGSLYLAGAIGGASFVVELPAASSSLSFVGDRQASLAAAMRTAGERRPSGQQGRPTWSSN